MDGNKAIKLIFSMLYADAMGYVQLSDKDHIHSSIDRFSLPSSFVYV